MRKYWLGEEASDEDGELSRPTAEGKDCSPRGYAVMPDKETKQSATKAANKQKLNETKRFNSPPKMSLQK